MRIGVILLAFAVVGYGAWGHIKTGNKTIEPLYAEPYLVVYGRESCGFTMDLVRKLERQGIAFDFENIDNRAVADPLHERMEASGIDTRRYNLPVVDLNNTIMIRPDAETVVARAKELAL